MAVNRHDLWEMYSKSGKTYLRLKNYNDAERMFQAALQEAESFGPGDPHLGGCTAPEREVQGGTPEPCRDPDPSHQRGDGLGSLRARSAGVPIGRCPGPCQGQ